MTDFSFNLVRAAAYPAPVFGADTREALAELNAFDHAEDGDVCALGLYYNTTYEGHQQEPLPVYAVKDGDSFAQPLFRSVEKAWRARAATAMCYLVEDSIFSASVGSLARRRLGNSSFGGCMVWVNSHGAVIEDSEVLHAKIAGRHRMADDAELRQIARHSFLGMFDEDAKGYDRIEAGCGVQSLLSWAVRSMEWSDDIQGQMIHALSSIELDIRDKDETGRMQRWAKLGRRLIAESCFA